MHIYIYIENISIKVNIIYILYMLGHGYINGLLFNISFFM